MPSRDPNAPEWQAFAEVVARRVIDHLTPILNQIRNDIDDYAYATARDREAEANRKTPRLLSPNAASKKFGVGANTLRREYHAGHIDGRYVGTYLKLLEESIVEWCMARDKPKPRPQPNPRLMADNRRPPPRYI